VHRTYQAKADQPRRPARWLAWLPWLVAVYVATGFFTVRPNEQAIVRRCGKALSPPRGPGLHFGFPYGIDQVSRVKMLEPKRIGVGINLTDRALGRRAEPRQAESLTGDRNLILISAVVQYQVADANAYLFHAADVPGLISNVATSAFASVISSMNVDDVLTVERITVQNRVKQTAQTMLDRCGAGVLVISVLLDESTAPPPEVVEAFRDVTSAREDRRRAINEAEGYRRRVIPQARGEARRVLLEAEGFGSEVIQKAEGEAERFLSVAAQLSANRRLTTRRLILEAMEEILPRLKKVIVDGRASDAVDLGLFEEK
jgi:membrane protease subunit HflK